MSFRIIRDDITRVFADAIVNTANPEPCFGNGTDRAIYEAAGAEQLLAARKRIGSLAAGQAAVTDAFALSARVIIHTVGPAWIDGRHGEYETLVSCYRNSLALAEERGCKSIAFPLISTGVYGFPKAGALRVALDTISAYLGTSEQDMDVILVVFNREAFEISASLHESVDQYIDENYVKEKRRQEHPFSLHDGRRRKPSASFSGEAGRRQESPDTLYNGSVGGSRPEQGASVPGMPEESLFFEEMAPESDAFSSQSVPQTDDAGSNNLEEWPSSDFWREENDRIVDSVSYSVTELPSQPQFCESPAPHAKKTNVLLDTLEFLRERLPFGKPTEIDLKNALSHPGESFQEMLLRLIDERNLTDPQVYKKANIDRKLFSKIRCTPDYRPRKKTVLALAIALELDLPETVELLGRAEMAFSPASRSDLIIEYCIENGIYNIFDINALLFEYEQPLLC